MSVLEVIRLRMAGDDSETLERVVQAAVENAGEAPEVRIYRHARVEGDLLLHLHHPPSEERTEASEVGIRLAAILRAHGLVDHSVWVGNEGPDKTT
jgi:hypothetical protein